MTSPEDLNKIYDNDYWRKKADVLLKEKKGYILENSQMRGELRQLQTSNKELKGKVKHLSEVIAKF